MKQAMTKLCPNIFIGNEEQIDKVQNTKFLGSVIY